MDCNIDDQQYYGVNRQYTVHTSVCPRRRWALNTENITYTKSTAQQRVTIFQSTKSAARDAQYSNALIAEAQRNELFDQAENSATSAMTQRVFLSSQTATYFLLPSTTPHFVMFWKKKSVIR